MGPVALREAPCSYFLFLFASLFRILFRWIEIVLESAGISSDVLLDHWRLHFVILHFLGFPSSEFLHRQRLSASPCLSYSLLFLTFFLICLYTSTCILAVF